MRKHQAIRLDERQGEGLVWLEGSRLGDGIIEFDVRGKDIFQQSFVGFAFHAADDQTFDAVYFRPFNFKNPDPARSNHAVQYVSHPLDLQVATLTEGVHRIAYPWGMRNNLVVFSGADGSLIGWAPIPGSLRRRNPAA